MFTEDVLKICIAQIAKYVGFRFINSSSFEILIDLLIKYILEFGKLSVSFANQCNRTPKEINFNDICFVFKSMGLNLNDLSDYLLNVNLPFAGPLLPKLPIDNKKTFRIQLPNKIECELRKEFYQDWQPSLNNFHKNLNNLKLEDKQLIDNRLEELDLVDYFEQKRNLKIIDNQNLNRQILNRITNKINKFNISGFTELTAQTPNYIYLSEEGEVLSFGNKPGKLAEPRQHNKLIIKSDYSKRRSVVDCLKESKKSKRRLRKEKKRKLLSSNNLATIVENSSSSSLTQFELLKQQIINKQLDKLNRIKEINKIKRLKPIEDLGKSCEKIVSELIDEMISSVEDNLNGKLDESFYDENEAARTLVLLSYDNKNTSTTNSINELSPKLNDDETNIDYSLTTKYNYDLNNNYTTMNDLNNNQINQKKENGYSNNLINYHNHNNNNNLKYDKYHLKKNNLIDQQSNDMIQKLTIRDEQFDEPINLSTNSNKLLNNNSNNFNNSNTSINSNSSCKNGAKLEIRLSFDEFKRNSDVALMNNTINATSNKDLINLNTFEISESKLIIDEEPISKSINSRSIDNSTDHSLINNNNHLDSTTKDKQKRKRKSKKLNNSIQSIDDDSNSRKSINNTSINLSNQLDDSKSSSKKQKKKSRENGNLEEVYICPTCSKPENGSPWIACDKCSNWYHWQCQNIFIAPKEEEWYCLDCKVNEELEAQKLQKKSLKKKLIKDKLKDDKHNKKRSKDVQKQEDKKLNKNLNKKNHQDEIVEDKWNCPTCSNGDDGSEMIGCDRCDYWYHYRCVNLTKAPPKNENWYCKNCSVKKRKLKK